MKSINKINNLKINKGVELILENRREIEEPKTKPKGIGFFKKISLLKREILIEFNIAIVKK